MALRGSRRRAAVTLFLSGWSFVATARLLHVTSTEVIEAVRSFGKKGRL